jgi:hypothetical protein
VWRLESGEREERKEERREDGREKRGEERETTNPRL